MSAWRQKTINCIPELKQDFEDPETSIYGVFFEILPALIEAHKKQDTERIEKIYGFAEWCFKQKELWNAAGVAFYEHLVDYEEAKLEIEKWVKFDIYKEIRSLLEIRIGKDEVLKLDKKYKGR